MKVLGCVVEFSHLLTRLSRPFSIFAPSALETIVPLKWDLSQSSAVSSALFLFLLSWTSFAISSTRCPSSVSSITSMPVSLTASFSASLSAISRLVSLPAREGAQWKPQMSSDSFSFSSLTLFASSALDRCAFTSLSSRSLFTLHTLGNLSQLLIGVGLRTLLLFKRPQLFHFTAFQLLCFHSRMLRDVFPGRNLIKHAVCHINLVLTVVRNKPYLGRPFFIFRYARKKKELQACYKFQSQGNGNLFYWLSNELCNPLRHAIKSPPLHHGSDIDSIRILTMPFDDLGHNSRIINSGTFIGIDYLYCLLLNEEDQVNVYLQS